MNADFLRNFCILAHIDHGKSTLADRFLEITETVEKRKMKEQFLDQMDLERERGITIKMQPVRMIYRPHRGTDMGPHPSAQVEDVILNLIDTPGHVDFSYEVSRALAAVEGAILLVDATQGVQAQTLANLHFAQKEGLVIIPVINKIDLLSADVKKTEEELVGLLRVLPGEIFKISAKTGDGVEGLLAAVIKKLPPPQAKFEYLNTETAEEIPLRALIFDSSYDSFQGVIAHVRVFEGHLSSGESIFFMASGARGEVQEVGFFAPNRISQKEIRQGEIGYIATGLKEPEKVRVGDTITKFKIQSSRFKIAVAPLPGYKEPMPVVFASLFPENQDDYESLRESLKKLKLNDAAVMFEPEEAGVLGRGMRTGFLGMLHMEITAERLRREYGQNVIFSNPSVKFKIKKKSGEEVFVYSAGRLPPAHEIESMEEPMTMVEVLTSLLT